MAIGTSYDEQEVVEAIANALETFYGSLIEKIDALPLQSKGDGECVRNRRVCSKCICFFK